MIIRYLSADEPHRLLLRGLFLVTGAVLGIAVLLAIVSAGAALYLSVHSISSLYNDWLDDATFAAEELFDW